MAEKDAHVKAGGTRKAEARVLLATDREGYGNLSELITRGRRQALKGEYLLTRGLDRGDSIHVTGFVPDATLVASAVDETAAALQLDRYAQHC